jgi:hypothetical protein
MKKSFKHRCLRTAAMAACLALAGPALADISAGSATFTSDRASYVGQYNAADRAISVDIDGLLYRGHYAEGAAGAAHGSTAKAGQWGRAFLMASSAKVLQCQLDAGFPQVIGLCQDSDGRKFELGQAVSR